ncbi:D-alanyl-D-alanine carboxypeptidase/D-alanyl-D-alanine-endopeptidase [Viridibacillus sp. YIM B01967]|uniref:D-alanyl-D-alanine carboxypeptidase/D-alanyl-D-alanine-endopeptidase n=1 Tax=Viridibacillus soli TaxID=2798301 RepID=A0ABS1H237_9BACL|nr:D-alanyl-D-alanine carboxypeptidase/D-alanyl-D-alanine-endopeptidase [Viridibacillus soli]MBK3493472.1 D-alanyl-D-alanine carboxypeptidase/D-alanyl-D-alanine-endopeptidase [Viridibacillus soli]
MQRKLSLLLKVVMLMLSVLLFGNTIDAGTQDVSQLRDDVETIIKEKLDGAEVSISVRQKDSGQMLYSYKGSKEIKPASNMKLLTSAAALDVLGNDYRFKTQLYTNGKIVNGLLKGDLYIRGEGDPTLSKEDLEQFAKTLKSKGVQTVDGHLIGDDTWFDDDLLTPGIEWDDEPYYYAAPITALTTAPNTDYDTGTVIVDVAIKEGAKVPTIKVTPYIGNMKLINKVKTVDANEKNTLEITRHYKSNQIVISGNLPIGQTEREWITVEHPTLYTLSLFQKVLKDAGIKFNSEHVIKLSKTPKIATLLAGKKSIPLKEIMIPYMKLSNNGIADILVKTMGRVEKSEGSTKAGLQVVRKYGELLKLNIRAWTFEDGSGMSHKNSVSSNEFTQLLYKVQKEKTWYKTFYTSLPVAANSERMIGGSLRNRFKDPVTAGKVFAKTGGLNDVNTLSGYVQADSGKWYIFSILVQNKSDTIPAIDDIVTVIAKEL